ncbi:MAG: twin-arginine translocase subunit TatC [Spirochaetaceae bacterium]|nr:MAG: twin-arginine translocase subunit TatC [Spirochaetaceae bacterium]
MSFVDHLSELRKRLIIVFLSLVAGSAACFVFVETIVEELLALAPGAEMVYLAPPELFLAYVRISLMLGIVLTLPITLSQIWFFVRPALSRREKVSVAFILFGGSVFFAAGAVFAFRIILPLTMRFFLQYATRAIQPMFSFGGYVGFVISILLAFGIAFELPVVVTILARVGLVSPAMLRSSRKYVLVALVILSAVLTPPDVVSQVLLAGPMMGLFEISILFARIVARRKREQDPSG